MNTILSDLTNTAPVSGTIILGLILILVNAMKKDSEPLQFVLALLGIAANLALAVWTFPLRGTAFNGMLLTGGFASVTACLFLLAAGLTVFLSRDYIEKIGVNFGEFYILIVLAVSGMMVFASAVDFIATFIGLEIMSVCLYILAGFPRRHGRANEASLKYFLLGAFSTGFFLYGIALIYGASGTTNILQIVKQLPALKTQTLFLTGIGLVLIGLAFKVGAVPFHAWVPDVYEGSPTMVSAFMSTGAKAAAFAAFILIFIHAFNFVGDKITYVIALLSLASMILGNVVAIAQSGVKRMLAYSSIAHAGYMLIGLAAGTMASLHGVLFYLISYTLTNVGAFGVLSILEDEKQSPVQISDFNGLLHRKPLLAVFMAIFMFSLVGLPPFSGFFGKYYIFVAAIRNNLTWLTIVGVITSMISAYYYLRVVVAMFFSDATSGDAIRVSPNGVFSLSVSVLGIFVVGIFPSLVMYWMNWLF